ncbi:hypothetical protein PIROE2DRAFT_16419 [Piromyces sp. E2]|nr:hypothetical protein PIROE2DRAFT_16419 [Piromyces sp. E2]|eukprot:OUM58335.1 hypothetical protein PIROE2DRAFT_16419 [Piromyces sp. E2]
MMKNSLYQAAKENLSSENFGSLSSNAQPEDFENTVDIQDQQSELEIDAINECVSVLSLYEEESKPTNDNDNDVSGINDGISAEIDNDGNFSGSVDVKSIDVKASSYGEALEIITDKLLNRLDYAEESEKDSIARALGKIYKSLSLRSISDPDPDTTATLNILYKEIYNKLTSANPEYKENLEPPMNTGKYDYLSKRERVYSQKLNLVKDKSSKKIRKMDEIFKGRDGNTYSKYTSLMANALKYKLIEGIEKNSPEIKNMVLRKLNGLSEVYNELKKELASTEGPKLKNFENKLLEMADIMDTYNDIYSIALINGITRYAENNKNLLPLEASDKMVKCLNVLKYNRLVRLLKAFKRFDDNLLPDSNIDKNSNKPSYKNLNNHKNTLSLSEIFKNIDKLDLPSPPLSYVVIFLSIFKSFDDYIGGLEEKYITNNAAKLIGKNSEDLNEGIEKSLLINSPLDRDPEDFYFSRMLSSVFDSGFDSNSINNEDIYEEIMADSITSVLTELKSFTNDQKLLPMDEEVKVNEDTGEIIQDTLVEGETTIDGAMDYVNDKVKELNESDDPQSKELTDKINKKLKKALKKAKKQLIKSVGHTSVSNIVKAAEYIDALEKVVRSSENGNSPVSSSSFVNKIKEISKSYNTDSVNKNKKIRNRKLLKQLKKTLKKLRISKKK